MDTFVTLLGVTNGSLTGAQADQAFHPLGNKSGTRFGWGFTS
jgi:hypothetical protein